MATDPDTRLLQAELDRALDRIARVRAAVYWLADRGAIPTQVFDGLMTAGLRADTDRG